VLGSTVPTGVGITTQTQWLKKLEAPANFCSNANPRDTCAIIYSESEYHATLANVLAMITGIVV
jgi:hypothetical protein